MRRSGSGSTETHCSRAGSAGTAHQHPFGLLHLHGNVAEWCASAWSDTHTARAPLCTVDPGAYVVRRVDTFARRVFRGGRWGYVVPKVARSASRDWMPPYGRHDDLGFRLLRPPPQPGGGG